MMAIVKALAHFILDVIATLVGLVLAFILVVIVATFFVVAIPVLLTMLVVACVSVVCCLVSGLDNEDAGR